MLTWFDSEVYCEKATLYSNPLYYSLSRLGGTVSRGGKFGLPSTWSVYLSFHGRTLLWRAFNYGHEEVVKAPLE